MIKKLTITIILVLLAFVTSFSNYNFVNLENSYFVEQPITINVQLNTNHYYMFELYSTINETDTLLQTTTAYNTTSTQLSYIFTEEYDSLFIKVYQRTSTTEYDIIGTSEYFNIVYGNVNGSLPNNLSYMKSFIFSGETDNIYIPYTFYIVYKSDVNTEIFIGNSHNTELFDLNTTISKYYNNDYELKVLIKYNNVVLFETPYTSINTNDIDNIIAEIQNDLNSQINELSDLLSNANNEVEYWKTLYNNLSEQYVFEKLQYEEMISLKNDTILSLRDSIEYLLENPIVKYDTVNKIITVIVEDPLDVNTTTVIYKFNEPFENEIMTETSNAIIFEDGGERQFIVVDLNGRVVLNNTTSSRFHPSYYDMPSGTYFLYLRVSGENHINHRLIKINYQK